MRRGPGTSNAGHGRRCRAAAARRTRRGGRRRPPASERAEQRAAALDQRLEHAVRGRGARDVASRSTPTPSVAGATISTLAPAARHASTAPARRGVGRDDERRRERRRRTAGPSAGTRPRASSSTRSGGCSGGAVDVAHGERAAGRRARCPAPTTIAWESARSSCASARAARTGDPLRRAVGRGDAAVEAQRDLGDDERRGRCGGGAGTARGRRAAASAPTPTSTSMPAARSRAKPAPATCGSGSSSATTTRATPASISASAHGGVRPWWAHGSSVTYAVAPRARSPASRSAATSACAPAGRLGRALADDLAVADEHAADPRVRRGAAAGGGAGEPAPAPSPRRRARSLTRVRPAGRGDDDAARPRTPRERARPPRTASTPSPIRTLTVGPGISPGRRPAGCRGVRGLTAGRDLHPDPEGVTAGRDLHPTPRAGSCSLRTGHYRGRKLQRVLLIPARRCIGSSVGVSGGGRRRGGRGRGRRSGGRTSRPSTAPLDEPGRLQISACAHGCPQTPRDSIPKPRPPASLARRIASASPGASRSITARVPSGVRSRGPKPVPPVVTTSPAKPSVSSRSAPATASTPSALTRWSTTS